MGGRVDGMETNELYLGRMRRIWLALLLAFSLAAGGVASAAAPVCPMLQASVEHDCCPHGKAPHDGAPQKKTDSCIMGAMCVSAPAIEQLAAVMPTSPASTAVDRRPLGETQSHQGQFSEYWRPPRAV